MIVSFVGFLNFNVGISWKFKDLEVVFELEMIGEEIVMNV